MAKPTTLEELRLWVQGHERDGYIGNNPIILDGRAEFRHGLVPGDLYDLALLVSAPFSYTKSDIAIIGANRLLANAVIDGAKSGAIAPADVESGTEFRAYFPQGLYNILQATKRELKWSNSQLMGMILTYFAHDPGVQKVYQQWLKDFSQANNCTAKDVEQAIYDRRRYQARVKRLELSEKAGELVSDRKIAT